MLDRPEYLYPVSSLLVVTICSLLAGFTTAPQIASFYQAHIKVFIKYLPDLPEKPISHDTVRNLVLTVGKDKQCQLLKSFTEPLFSDDTNRRHLVLDGQSIRASRKTPNQCFHALNLYSASDGLCLNQISIAEKNNEITEATNIFKGFDISGAIVSADAIQTQHKLMAYLVEKNGADFCIALKNNQPKLAEEVADIFADSSNLVDKVVVDEPGDLNRERIEQRHIEILPATYLSAKLQDKWPHIHCLIKIDSTTTSKAHNKTSHGTRYFVSSLYPEPSTIGPLIQQVIRRHWSIENELHWVLDLTFNQDRTHCRNADFSNGMLQLNKIANNLMSMAQKERGTDKAKPSKKELQGLFANPEQSIEFLCKTYAT